MVYGKIIDEETRCVHYKTENDIVAIKFRCCVKYYPCYKCHEESEEHKIEKWKTDEFDEKAILCGVCNTEHTITEYINRDKCKKCDSEFNSNCRFHRHLYFEY